MHRRRYSFGRGDFHHFTRRVRSACGLGIGDHRLKIPREVLPTDHVTLTGLRIEPKSLWSAPGALETLQIASGTP